MLSVGDIYNECGNIKLILYISNPYWLGYCLYRRFKMLDLKTSRIEFGVQEQDAKKEMVLFPQC